MENNQLICWGLSADILCKDYGIIIMINNLGAPLSRKYYLNDFIVLAIFSIIAILFVRGWVDMHTTGDALLNGFH